MLSWGRIAAAAARPTRWTPANARLTSTKIPRIFDFDRDSQVVHEYNDQGTAPIAALPPSRRLIIVTCMDARIDPVAHLGLKEGEAHVIRNAGGVARDALRSIVISQRLLGTREVAVFHHTGCSMVGFTSDSLRQLVKAQEPANTLVANQVDAIDFLEFSSDLKASVLDDITFLKNSPLLLRGTRLTGWIYDVESRESTRIV